MSFQAAIEDTSDRIDTDSARVLALDAVDEEFDSTCRHLFFIGVKHDTAGPEAVVVVRAEIVPDVLLVRQRVRNRNVRLDVVVSDVCRELEVLHLDFISRLKQIDDCITDFDDNVSLY